MIMEKRKIRILNEEKEVSLLGFGCMRFPTKDGEIAFEESKAMVMKAMENGVNYLDTAWPYHGGKSELFVKEITKDLKRESFYLANKLPIWECKTPEDVTRIFHEQLNKCGVEYFDFYLIHAVNEGRIKQIEELGLLKMLEEFRDEGKIRNIGFSFHDGLGAFKKWADLYDWDFVQIQLNYMDIDHQQGMEGYEILTKKNIPVIIMEPVKGGSLVNFNDEIVSKLKAYNKEDSVASWAFRWVASLPNVKVILSGMSNMEQVEDNLKTFKNFKPMNDEEYKIIDEVRVMVNDLSKVECTSCNYCMPCPHGVDIPRNFRVYNNHSMYKNDRGLKWAVGEMVRAGVSADKCIECNECIPKCPQFIEIPTRLAEYEDYLKENGVK
jgi:predicted aldo/keto reductase-like oxidoreductase